MSNYISYIIRLGAILLFCASATSTALALSISSSQPGNIFSDREAVSFHLTDMYGVAHYKVADYFGRAGKSGEPAAGAVAGTSDITLGSLKPGWYRLSYNDDKQSGEVTFGVVLDRVGKPLPEDGRVCADAAIAWWPKVWSFLESDRLRSFVSIVKKAGIPRVRERVWWASVEPSAGVFNWDGYQQVADAYAAEGIQVDQVWHDSPSWTHPGSTNAQDCPTDLRSIYTFARTAAGHFSRQVQSWEVWNEPDNAVSFFTGLGDRFSGLEKAAYFGIKDGNPHAMVLGGSMCKWIPDQFDKDLYASGLASYSDAFNEHRYDGLDTYPYGASQYALLNRTQQPVWMTESGLFLPKIPDGPNQGSLDDENQRVQCQFVPQSVATSLANGTARHFFFILPDFEQGTNQFGALHPDFTPRPAFVALSAAANEIGESEYIGQLEFQPSNGFIVRAQAFQTPTGAVLVVWANKPLVLALRTENANVAVDDLFGARMNVEAQNGQVNISIGPDAVYVRNLGSGLQENPHFRKKIPMPAPVPSIPAACRVVLVGYAQNLPINKDATEGGYYDLTTPAAAPDKPIQYRVEAYNFDTTRSATGRIRLSLPEGWQAEANDIDVTILPMGRKQIDCRVMPKLIASPLAAITVTGQFSDLVPAASVSYFKLNINALLASDPVRIESLPWTNPRSWHLETSPNGATDVRAVGRALQFTTHFSGPGDRWAYPSVSYATGIDASRYDGIQFDVDVAGEGPYDDINIQFVSPAGAVYMAGMKPVVGKHQVTVLFSALKWLEWSARYVTPELDLHKIVAIKVGSNTSRSDLAFKTGNFQFVKY